MYDFWQLAYVELSQPSRNEIGELRAKVQGEDCLGGGISMMGTNGLA
jgi:hypothetical protein